MALIERLKHGWNAFLNKDPTEKYLSYNDYGVGYSSRPDRIRFTRGNERSIVNSIFNRIAVDAASTTIEHVRVDDNERFQEIIFSGIQNCLNVEANIDQTGRAFIEDVVMSMEDEGCVAIVPIDTIYQLAYGLLFSLFQP